MVTAASSGIGLDVAKKLIAKGYRMVSNFRNITHAPVAIVRFRDGKLFNEHIYWDQASVLVRLGLLDPSTLAIAGVKTARKVPDPSLPSNS